MDYLDFLFAFLILALALCLPARYLPPERREPAAEHWLFRRGHRAILAVFGASLLINIVFALSYEIPVPLIHDEYAYLLASDTFSAGRLTNPTHPMWKHFESFHVFHTPTYQAKYPPGQGLFLALGQVVSGEPAVGVWLSLALACAAVTWMLMAVLPVSWATLGGFLAAVCPQMLLWWGQSYWGGAAAMFGGTLMFGALFRFQSRVRTWDAIALAAGVVILANTRPYEGLIVSIPSAFYALRLTATWVKKDGWRRVTVRFLIPAAAVLLVAGAGLIAYNAALVGDPWKLPYTHYQSQVPDSELMRRYTGSPPISLTSKLLGFWAFYLGPLLTMALFSLKSVFQTRESAFALAVAILLFMVSALTTPAWPHYTAPVACLVYLVLVEGLRGLRQIRWLGRPVGALLSRAVPVAYVTSSLIMVGALVEGGPATLWAHERQAVAERLEADGERHLIVVRYGPGHSLHAEWVYNRADVDAARVVWARERTPAENRQLFEYFKDRRKWLVLADERPPRLVPLEERASPGEAPRQ